MDIDFVPWNVVKFGMWVVAMALQRVCWAGQAAVGVAFKFLSSAVHVVYYSEVQIVLFVQWLEQW